MLHFIQDTFFRLALSGSFIGVTGSGSASRRVIIFDNSSSQNTAKQQVQTSIKGISLQLSSVLENHSENRQQGIAPIVPKWVDKNQEVATINKFCAIIWRQSSYKLISKD